jgi:hypothetical protein
MKRRVEIERKGNKISIHYNYAMDLDIASDDKFRRLIIDAMNWNKGVVTRFKSSGWASYKKAMDEKAWALSILKKVSNEKEAALLQNFKVVEMDHPVQQFKTNLFKNLKEAHEYLYTTHRIDKDEALYLLLDILQGWFPDVPEIQEIKFGAFKKALQRMK